MTAVAPRVLVVDDHMMMVDMLSAALERAGFSVCGTALTAAEAVARARAERPDIVVMDELLGPDDRGTDAARAIKIANPNVKVIIFSAMGERVAPRALDAGCEGIVSKVAPLEELLQTMRRVLQGETVYADLDPETVVTPARPPLTKRELEVLRWLARGASSREIAGELHISVSTLRVHVQRIMEKMGTHSRLEAVAMAAREGWIDLSPDVTQQDTP